MTMFLPKNPQTGLDHSCPWNEIELNHSPSLPGPLYLETAHKGFPSQTLQVSVLGIVILLSSCNFNFKDSWGNNSERIVDGKASAPNHQGQSPGFQEPKLISH